MPQKKILLFVLLLISSFFLGTRIARGDELDDINKQINELTSALSQSKAASAPLEQQLGSIKARVAFIETDLVRKQNDIDKSYKNLETQTEKLNIAIRNYYIKSYYNSPILVFLSASSATKITQVLAYQKAAADQDKLIIINIALLINSLEEKKANLENEKKKLADTKVKLDKIVGDAKSFQGTLTGKIAELSAKQQAILSQRLSSLNIPLYASTGGGCSSDLTNGKDPGFGNAFGFFTYGVPNRVGLNQYGALGRAKANQNFDTILHAYYNFDSYQSVDVNTNIRVNDSNGIDSGNIIWSGGLEDYIKRIYEVPESWPSEALKAQVIAIRSYVLAQTNNGARSICANQHCQVFQTNPKGGAWDQAVNDTAGQAMIQGGAPIAAYFSSTHGGYVHSSGGDISSRPWLKNAQDASNSIGSFSDLQANAYDKDSPWFYCDWGSRSQYGGTAWLKSEEVADIANVLLLVQNDGSTKEHLYQPDKPNLAGTDTWDAGRVKQELQNRHITPFNSVSNVSVSADFGSGNTNSITISGDRIQNFSASDFKTYFNLRAPANIQIVGPLYNVERK